MADNLWPSGGASVPARFRVHFWLALLVLVVVGAQPACTLRKGIASPTPSPSLTQEPALTPTPIPPSAQAPTPEPVAAWVRISGPPEKAVAFLYEGALETRDRWKGEVPTPLYIETEQGSIWSAVVGTYHMPVWQKEAELPTKPEACCASFSIREAIREYQLPSLPGKSASAFLLVQKGFEVQGRQFFVILEDGSLWWLGLWNVWGGDWWPSKVLPTLVPTPTAGAPAGLAYDSDMVTVPEGAFLMGSTEADTWAFSDEKPQHSLRLLTFQIGRYPVTNAEFARFMGDGGYLRSELWTEAGWQVRKAEGWTQPRYWGSDPSSDSSKPVMGVSWYEAVAYCNWLAEKTGKPYRLPTEAEWEKAARGPDGRLWPWGNELDPSRGNTRESDLEKPTSVGQYSPQGDSPYGVADMAGNVEEWTSSLYKDYPYDPQDGRESMEAEGYRVTRGGSYWNDLGRVRCAARGWAPANTESLWIGFRVALGAVSP